VLTRVKYRFCQLDMAKMTWTLRHTLPTRLTLKVPIDSAHTRIHEPPKLRFMSRLVHDLGVLDSNDGVSFLLRMCVE
jgi:hypothetical protein